MCRRPGLPAALALERGPQIATSAADRGADVAGHGALGIRQHRMGHYSADEPFWDVTPSGPIVVVPHAIDTNDMKMWHDTGYTDRNWLDSLVDTFDEL